MSWSVSCIGKPENVAAELDRQSATMDGQSKVEFDDALPHLKALVLQTFAKDGSGCTLPVIELSANGSGIAKQDADGGPPEQVSRNITVSIRPHWTKLV